MIKFTKKLLSTVLSVSILAACAVGIISSDALTEVNPQDKLITISDCSKFTGNDTTTNVPDGEGMKIAITDTTNSKNILASHMNQSVEFTKEKLSKGAFIIYFGHDKIRTLADSTTETAYADSLFLFRFNNNGTNVDLRIGGTAAETKPVYFISSTDGTVIRNDTNNTSTKLPIDTDGNYYNEGYWVIPGASLQLGNFSDTASYPLTLVQCNPRNMTTYLSAVKASCNYYYDNLAFVENIEDLLGTVGEEGYQYDAGTTYPVYKLGYMTGETDAAPELSVSAGDITVSGLVGTTNLSIYRYGKYYVSAETSASKYTFTDLATGSYTVQIAQVEENGKYSGVSEIAAKDIIATSNIQMLRDYSELTPYNGTTGNGVDCVPDGFGFMASASGKTYNDFFHTTDNDIQLDADLAQNGALIFYFKHDTVRTVDGVEETAYVDVIPNLIFTKEGVEGNNVVVIKSSTASRQPIYFISSEDGTVIRNETYNSSLQLAKSGDTYYNEGYWVIPLSAFTNKATDGTYEFNSEQTDGYTLTAIKCTYRNIKSLTENNTLISSTCNYYFDNFAYVENIEDILGPIVSGTKGTMSAVYTYDRDSRYPVYTLGALDTAEGTKGIDKENNQVMRSKNSIKITRASLLEGKAWTVNVYANKDGLICSKDISADVSEFVLDVDNYRTMKVQIVADGEVFAATSINRAGDVRDDKNIDVRDLVAMKKLVVNLQSKYNSDIDGDGDTKAEDVVLLRKMLLGMEIE